MEALKLIRYKGARRIFDVLFNYPERQFTINELAREAGVPFASAWRLIQLWEPAGIVETGRLGRSRIVRFHRSAFTEQLAKMLRLSVSPQAFTVQRLRTIFEKEKNIRRAYVFGSVARKEERVVSDIDLAMVVKKNYNINKLMFDVYERYGTKIIPLTFKSERELNAFLKDKEKVRIK